MEDNIKQHHFTVVIPTRERCDTLKHSLRTCIMQQYDNLEIIVSDNFSQDHTREVVEAYQDPRIRYINTGERISMTDNFEFALSHVKPEGYIIYIGDDDGLLPNSIRDINAIIHKTGAEVVRWEPATYIWPGVYRDREPHLTIPSLKSNMITRKSSSVIRDVLSFERIFTSLPMIYMRAAVSYKLIRKVKSLSKKFFHSMTPDVYSGFAIAGSIDNFVDLERPYGLVGSSKHSNGASATGSSSYKEPFQKYLSEPNPSFHPSLVFTCSLPLIIVDSFLQAKDELPYFHELEIDKRLLLFKMMEDTALRAEDNYMECKSAVLQLAQMHNLKDAAKQAIEANPMKLPGSSRKVSLYNIVRACFLLSHQFGSDIQKKSIGVNCAYLDVKNIYDASLLCHHILGLHDVNFFGFSSVISSALLRMKRKVEGISK
ncbi:MAG: glycosyltransferase family 2 protein [Candidatus Electrothrix sp. AX2]|nr:glycosyltransferase family 2 protein [Candidatus Electrothrix gigas]